MWAINLRIAAVVLGTLAIYTLIANKIPQVQSEVPRALALGADVTPEQLVSAGDELYNGSGGCTACHGLGTRAPNITSDEKGQGAIGARCGSREPGKDCKAYLHEALTRPGAFVVPGYEPIMPDVSRTLSPQQIWALVAYLESLGGTVTVTAADIPAAGGLTPGASPGNTQSGGGSTAFAGGSTDPMAMLRDGGCVGCHKIGEEGGAVGPDLSRVGARLNAAGIREAILAPDAKISPGFENFAGIMPKNYGEQMTAGQLEALVRFLGGRK
ncbi:MAG: c-type cytochrome [Gemmatimonadales bacterium]|nr:c-type cytochrome [Gemmatimonadales bacterium]